MEERLHSMHAERKKVENIIIDATIKIQKVARGFITRMKIEKVKEIQDKYEKAKLYEALASMEQMTDKVAEGICESPIKKVAKEIIVKKASMEVLPVVNREEEGARKIQKQAKVFLSKLRFRQALYKLILFKNIVETKVHKERMQLLFAFEQMIINTEDTQD